MSFMKRTPVPVSARVKEPLQRLASPNPSGRAEDMNEYVTIADNLPIPSAVIWVVQNESGFLDAFDTYENARASIAETSGEATKGNKPIAETVLDKDPDNGDVSFIRIDYLGDEGVFSYTIECNALWAEPVHF